MEAISIAYELECSLQQQIDLFSGVSSQELTPVIAYINDLQKDFIENLAAAKSIDIDTEEYPQIGNKLLNIGKDWEKIVSDKLFLSAATNDLLILWSLHTAFDRMEQFYRQSALNNAYPSIRAYFNSLAEVKMLLRRRFHGLIHVIYNDIWGKVGFAPFMLGKD